MLSLIGAVGGIGGSIVATLMAGKDYWGLPGWRLAFIMVALVSFIIGILVYLYSTDPRRIPGNHLLDDDDYERYFPLLIFKLCVCLIYFILSCCEASLIRTSTRVLLKRV